MIKQKIDIFEILILIIKKFQHPDEEIVLKRQKMSHFGLNENNRKRYILHCKFCQQCNKNNMVNKKTMGTGNLNNNLSFLMK